MEEFASDTIEIQCTQKSKVWMDLRACLITATSIYSSTAKIREKANWFIVQNGDAEISGRQQWMEKGSPLDWVKSVKYGEKWEDAARLDYDAFRRVVKSDAEPVRSDIGIMIDPEGMYGGSPDGVFGSGDEKAVLEIKCPSGRWFRDNPSWPISEQLTAGTTTLPDWCKKWKDEGKPLKKANPGYYNQCVVNMYLNGANFADFIAWQPGQDWNKRAQERGPKSFGRERIEKDETTDAEFEKMVRWIQKTHGELEEEFRINKVAFMTLYRDEENPEWFQLAKVKRAFKKLTGEHLDMERADPPEEPPAKRAKRDEALRRALKLLS
jgi:hypothetical protein